jgi:hypothetical protein
MKKQLACALFLLVAIAAAGYSWYAFGSTSSGGASGFPLVCAHCDHFFALSESELTTHPKSPTGEGFKCPKCGRFGARVAAKCDRCGQWVIMARDASGASYCPKCTKEKKP